MKNAMIDGRFNELNLDPALAEAVTAVSKDQILEGIIRLEDPSKPPTGFQPVARFNRICTGRFRAEDTWEIRKDPNVLSLKAARLVGPAEPDQYLRRNAAPGSSGRDRFQLFTGRGSVVAMLDFGIDFGHPTFRNEDGSTRLMALWHQGMPYNAEYPNAYRYGRIFSRQEIDAALRETDPYEALGYHPAISDTGYGSHGTHTTDIAAGNGRAAGSTPGIAPHAHLLFVHLSTPRAAGNLGDSVRLLEALHYVHQAAGEHPCAVNLSVGRTAGPHDGTSLFEQAMHELLRAEKGRAIVQSAGNYRSAHLAANGWLRDGAYRDLAWIIDPRDTTGNEIDAWYSGNDRFLVALQSPTMSGWIEVPLGKSVDLIEDDDLIGRLFHRKNDPTNNDNHIDLFLYPNAPAGRWRLRLYGDYVINGRFHAWVERESSTPGGQSRFDPHITTQDFTLGTIATSPLVLTVGAFDSHADDTPLAHFSSCGPTRDGRREKPELLAPGVDIVAARSIPMNATEQRGLLIAKSGTSMAAPVVTGTIAAMFEAAGLPLSIAEIRACLKETAFGKRGDAHNDCCGWGRVNIDAALAAASGLRILPEEDNVEFLTPEHHAFQSATSREQSMNWSGGTVRADFKPAERNRYLDLAERILLGSMNGEKAPRNHFFHALMREVGGEAIRVATPAALYREATTDWARMKGLRRLFHIIGLPGFAPETPVCEGDWMLRFVPGVGHSGHLSLLASPKLIPYVDLVSQGLVAEGNRLGYYGAVTEGGEFPHLRKSLFARRHLDSHLRVPVNTIIIRPAAFSRYAESGWNDRRETTNWNAASFRTDTPSPTGQILARDVPATVKFDGNAHHLDQIEAGEEDRATADNKLVSIDEQSGASDLTLVALRASDSPEFRAIMVKGWSETEDLVTEHPKKFAALLAAFRKAQEAGKVPGDWIDNTPTDKIIMYQTEAGKANGLVFFANMTKDTDGKISAEGSSDKTHQPSTSLKWTVDGKITSLDPATVPYVALPPELVAASGARLGDLIRMKDGDQVVFGVYGDGGPHLKSGEASTKVHKLFGEGIRSLSSDLPENQRIEYTILTGSGARHGLGPHGVWRSSDEIQRTGADEYRRFVRRIRAPVGSDSPPAEEQAPTSAVTAAAEASTLMTYHWVRRGAAPRGYIKGMALAFAAASRLLKQNDPVLLEITKPRTNDPGRDILDWYAAELSAVGAKDNTPVTRLVAVFTVLLGLGMRESSGRHCEGYDTPEDRGPPGQPIATTPENAEAGLFQVSYNSVGAHADRLSLVKSYRGRTDLLTEFSEDARCRKGSKHWPAECGVGEAASFQRQTKECPLFATLYAAMLLRQLRKEWGPIYGRRAEAKSEAVQLFSQIQGVVENE